ncbi:MAG TPA: OB-fold domain-containing protein [Devosia sp.]|jgi:hypothetical protein|uniref:Zn-ribbon domain-containing OB-fold protein n=1 Tax=Devosia sp. TaxID=1871048 RepID=UPI002DDD6753|nr:OB-fold domain-containing protein [Devosia sp.]HEV2513807.1 OB-fold domain-containing protein [Devosia sp.]
MNLSELKVPGPTRTALTAPFWTAAAEGRFIVQHCADCASWVFYPRQICPHCWSQRLEWREASGRARLESWSVIHRPGHPGWEPAAPYAIGIVRLAEGPSMLSHILTADPQLHLPLQVRFTQVGAEILPCFEPADE